jgi:hypothetical protein
MMICLEEFLVLNVLILKIKFDLDKILCNHTTFETKGGTSKMLTATDYFSVMSRKASLLCPSFGCLSSVCQLLILFSFKNIDIIKQILKVKLV